MLRKKWICICLTLMLTMGSCFVISASAESSKIDYQKFHDVLKNLSSYTVSSTPMAVTVTPTPSPTVTITTTPLKTESPTLAPTPTPTVTPVPVTMYFDEQEVYLPINGTAKLTYTIENAATNKAKVKWNSSNPDVVTVSSGRLSGVTAGEAYISCEASLPDGAMLEARCKVNVYLPISSLEIHDAKQTICVGEQLQIDTVTILPEDALCHSLTWSSSDDNIAKSTQNGIIVGQKAGKAKITVTANAELEEKNAKSASFEITVIQPVEKIELDSEYMLLAQKGSTTLKATVFPEDATDKKNHMDFF